MSRSEDLASVIVAAAQSGASDLGFRQGTVAAWDATTGTNTVTISGETFTDLPVLAAGTVVLAPGDVVGVLRFKHTYLLLGRINMPGNQHGNFLTAGLMGPADTQTLLWPSTTSTAFTDLVPY